MPPEILVPDAPAFRIVFPISKAPVEMPPPLLAVFPLMCCCDFRQQPAPDTASVMSSGVAAEGTVGNRQRPVVVDAATVAEP